MKKFISGLLVGFIVSLSSFAFAGNPIQLFINGEEIQTDVPSQIIDGRTMVPARYVFESLGYNVKKLKNIDTTPKTNPTIPYG